ncbi:hypothetical protein F441_11041 [Phytophthora nicotianae CJ01A1]|uniref:DUF8040 domain-containing protein n=1 Tax=Phytophthora nicotianae CJ01A1 TaxID=1317063 RepID=W2WWJ7_PHYNI|nr:hypothetical protein F441_11041 [Phytophthora nicotianae CJ01A1]
MSEDSVAQLEDASDEDEDVVRALALVAGYYGHTCFDKQPFHNSILTGSDWVAEIIEGNPTRMFRSYSMTKPVFRRFCAALDNADRQTPWSRVSVEEKAAIFLYRIAKNASNSDLQERFNTAEKPFISEFSHCGYVRALTNTLVALKQAFLPCS